MRAPSVIEDDGQLLPTFIEDWHTEVAVADLGPFQMIMILAF